MQYSISLIRDFGSLGRSIARTLSQKLGIEFYDRDIVEQVSRMLKLPVSTVSKKEESSKWRYKMFPLGSEDVIMQDMIFEVQKEIILGLAKEKSCIIVGRCSDAILQDQPNHLNIYIHAPISQRIENCVEKLGMNPSEARHMVLSVDKARKAYHKKYAGFLPGNQDHHHLCIDSSVLGVEGSADLIAYFVKKRFGE